MAYLHCRIRTRIQTQIRTPNPMATLHDADVFTLHSQIQIPIPPTMGMGSESESVAESVSHSVDEP